MSFFRKLGVRRKDKSGTTSPSTAPASPRTPPPALPASSSPSDFAPNGRSNGNSEPASPSSPLRLASVNRRRSVLHFDSIFASPKGRQNGSTVEAPPLTESSRLPSTPPAPPRVELDFITRGNLTPAERPVSVYFDGTGNPVTPDKGKRRQLSARESQFISERRVRLEHVTKAWEIVGADLVGIGACPPVVFRHFPSHDNPTIDSEAATLFAIFLVSTSPHELYPILPTVAPHFPPPQFASDEHDWMGDFAAASGWIKEPAALSAMLRRTLRAADRGIRSERDAGRRSVLPEWYTRFAAQEAQMGHPENAYSTLLLEFMASSELALLSEVLAVVASLLAHGRDNGLDEGYLCGILGWWTLGCVGSASEHDQALQSFTVDWCTAARAFSHLLRARIRDRARSEKLPFALRELVNQYGEEHLAIGEALRPVRMRQITLRREARSRAAMRYSAQTLLSLTLFQATRNDQDIPAWLSDELNAPGAATSSIASFPTINGKAVEWTSLTPSNTTETCLSSPYAITDTQSRSPNHNGTADQDADTVRGHVTKGETSGVLGNGHSAGTIPDWQEFTRLGFGDTASPTLARPFELSTSKDKAIGISPKVATQPGQEPELESSPVIQRAPDSGGRARSRRSLLPRDKESSKQALDAASAEWSISKVDWINVETGFLDFLEEAIGDPISSRSWPVYAVIRRTRGTTANPEIRECVLITVEDASTTRSKGSAPPIAQDPGKQLSASPPFSSHRQLAHSTSPPSHRAEAPALGHISRTEPLRAETAVILDLEKSDSGSLMTTLKRGRRKSLGLFKVFGSYTTPSDDRSLGDIREIGSTSPEARSHPVPDAAVPAPKQSEELGEQPFGKSISRTGQAAPLSSALISASPQIPSVSTPPVTVTVPGLLRSPASKMTAPRPNRSDSSASQRSTTRKPVPTLLTFEGNEGKLSMDMLRADPARTVLTEQELSRDALRHPGGEALHSIPITEPALTNDVLMDYKALEIDPTSAHILGVEATPVVIADSSASDRSRRSMAPSPASDTIAPSLSGNSGAGVTLVNEAETGLAKIHVGNTRESVYAQTSQAEIDPAQGGESWEFGGVNAPDSVSQPRNDQQDENISTNTSSDSGFAQSPRMADPAHVSDASSMMSKPKPEGAQALQAVGHGPAALDDQASGTKVIEGETCAQGTNPGQQQVIGTDILHNLGLGAPIV